MTLNDFQNEITSNITRYLSPSYHDAEITVNPVIKTNGVELLGLTIRRPGDNVTPTIYINSLYEDYVNGRDLEEIMRSIASTRQLHDGDIDLDVSSITDFDAIKDKIQIKLISRDKNQDYLRQGNKPHIDIAADLTEVFYVDLGEDSNKGFMSTMITESLCRQWGIKDINELHEIAVKNMTPKARFSSIFQVLSEMMPQEMSDNELCMEDNQMFVLTNDKRHLGAAMLLCPEVMDHVADQIGTKAYYILPSSVEETLIVPEKPGMNVAELAAMVREINSSDVIEKDIYLSDHVFQYDYDKHQLIAAA